MAYPLRACLANGALLRLAHHLVNGDRYGSIPQIMAILGRVNGFVDRCTHLSQANANCCRQESIIVDRYDALALVRLLCVVNVRGDVVGAVEVFGGPLTFGFILGAGMWCSFRGRNVFVVFRRWLFWPGPRGR